MKNKRRSLSLPLICSFFGFLFAVMLFGLLRYFFLADGSGFEKEIFFRVLWETLPALLAILLCGGVSLAVISFRVKKPVKKLCASSSKIFVRLANHEEKPPVFGAGCVGALSETLSAEEDKIALHIATVVRETDERATEREQRSAALRLCSTVSPESAALDFLTCGVQINILRSREVGADFCDGFALDGRRVFLAVGDVWERGLPAALFAARLVCGLLKEIGGGKSPAEALSALNAGLQESGMAATLFCAIFDRVTGELRYANAGQNPPIVAGEKCGFLRMRAGTPLGLYADAEYCDESFALRPGQGLVAYTNGVIDAFNGQEYFGYGRLLSTIGRYYGNALATEEVAEGILSAVGEFCEPEDDCAVLSLYFPAGFRKLLNAQLCELDRVRELLDSWLQSDPRKKNIQLACEEIFTNIVNHAGAKTILLGCEREDDSLIIRFTDDGEPFDPLQREIGEKELYSYADGGMGMTIIRRIAGEIFYRTKQNLNVLTLRFPIIKGI